jgi:hypothetical protein
MALSNNKDVETIAVFEGDEAKIFYEYATKKSTTKEKEELKEDLDFYYQHCPSTTHTINKS